MACGAGLVILALAVTIGHLIVVYLYPYLARIMPGGGKERSTALRLRYADGTGALRQALEECTNRDFVVDDVQVTRSAYEEEGVTTSEVVLRLHGVGPSGELAAAIADISGVRGFDLGTFEEPSE
jgi:putative Mg2+ transporter-C (MgtC) family protein